MTSKLTVIPKSRVIEGEVTKMEETKGDLSDIAKGVGNAVINEIEIETTVSKSTVKPFEDDGSGKGPNVFEKILRPKISVKGKDGNVIYVTAPYGEPKDIGNFVKAGAVAVVLGVVGAIFGAGRVSKRRRR